MTGSNRDVDPAQGQNSSCCFFFRKKRLLGFSEENRQKTFIFLAGSAVGTGRRTMKGAGVFGAIGLAAASLAFAQPVAPAGGLAPLPGLVAFSVAAKPLNLDVLDSVDWLVVYGVRHPPRISVPFADDAPLPSEAVTPKDLRIVPPASCPGMAYMTVAGQPATGNGLVGGLGSGDCW
jgi:hypothetical protein